MSVAAIVLAGGASSRFGGNKLAARLGDRPVLAHVVDAGTRAADAVVVVIGPDEPAPAMPGVAFARDPVEHQGPLAGLAAGLRAASTADAALVLAGDMPRVREDVLALLLETLAADPQLGAVYLESEPPLHPLPLAVRPGIVLPAANRLLDANRRSLRALVDAVPSAPLPASRWRALDPRGETLLDIDTPADLEASFPRPS